MNYFELYGIKESPFADKKIIAAKYIELQKKFHPDFFTNEGEDEKEEALLQSAHINKAYNIFKDADKTIEYFLQLKGIITADEKYNLPPDFLMEMMELNEAFDEDDKTGLQNKITALEEELNKPIAGFSAPEKAENFTEADLQGLKEYFYKKKYFKRLLERLDD